MDEARVPAPVLTAGLFSELRALLLEMLRELRKEEWTRPTAAPLWSVKDVALHLLGGDVSNLSRRRDRFQPAGQKFESYAELVAFINEINRTWVEAARRMSPRVLCDLLELTGRQMVEYWGSLDPFASGEPVSWAGSGAAPVWMDVAREYTEQWHHQQQIRDATGRAPLYEPRLFSPVLATFVLALPRAYANIEAAEGSVVEVQIEGDAGGTRYLRRGAQLWELLAHAKGRVVTRISIPPDAAWRLFTKGMDARAARARAKVEGDARLAEAFFGTVAIIG
jgi:uncharacterized protein (TIGR03083 family)